METSASDPNMSSEGETSTAEGETQAFLAWVKAMGVDCSLEDLCSSALPDVLASVDSQRFESTSLPAAAPYVAKLASLKRLYKGMVQYYADVMRTPVEELPMPDLDELARSSSLPEVCKMCRLAIGICVHSDSTKAAHISAIQTLDEAVQARLMIAIDAMMPKAAADAEEAGDVSAVSAAEVSSSHTDDAYYALVRQLDSLKDSHANLTTEKEQLQHELELLQEAQGQRSRPDEALLQELDGLRAQLRKSEDGLAEVEAELEKRKTVEKDLSKRIGELQSQADEAVKLKDQLDEYRHLADRAQRNENTLEKYKKRLEETAGLRRQLTQLEEQNSQLLSKQSTYDRDSARHADSKSQLEAVRGQLDQVRAENSGLEEALAATQYNAEQSALQVRALEEARNKAVEDSQASQERLRELEAHPDDSATMDTLDDDMQGTTPAELRQRLRTLTRELDAYRSQGDGALQMLLDEAKQQRQEQEDKYWQERKERTRVEGELDRARAESTEAKQPLEQAGSSTTPKDVGALQAKVQELTEQLSAMEPAGADSSSDHSKVGDNELLAELRSLRSSLPTKETNPELQGVLTKLLQRTDQEQSQRSALEEKLKKAKAFIRYQDRLLKDAQKQQSSTATSAESSTTAVTAQHESLQRENEQLKREQAAMMSAYHHMANARGAAPTGGLRSVPPAPKSWLGQQQMNRTGLSWALGRR